MTDERWELRAKELARKSVEWIYESLVGVTGRARDFVIGCHSVSNRVRGLVAILIMIILA